MTVDVRLPGEDANGNGVYSSNVQGRAITVQDGTLIVSDHETDGRAIAIYAAGSWLYAYVDLGGD